MTVSTLRPASTSSNSGVAVNGAASAHAALNDNSDSSYLDSFGSTDKINLTLDDLTLPSGAVIKDVAARVRAALSSAGSNEIIVSCGNAENTSAGGNRASIFPTWTTPTTVTAWATTTPSPYTAPWTDSDVDGLYLFLGRNVYGGSAALTRIYEAYVDVTYVAKPVVTPSLPTGTITATNLPTVEWDNTLDSDGGAQTHYQVRVFTSAQYGAGGFDAATSDATWDSGDVTSSAETATVTSQLGDGAHRAYVRVGQTVNGTTHWSDYAYTGFTIDVDLAAVPDSPTLTVQTGRIKVHVEGNTGTATTTHLEVQRSEDGGTTWEPLRLTTDTDGLVAGTSADLYDYEAPNGTVMKYRVRALHEVSTGNYVASDWAATASATWTDTAWWLKCPEQPALNMIVYPDSLPGYQRPSRQGVFQALGSTETVIVADTRGAPRGTLRLQIDTPAEQDDLDALLDTNATLLLQCPPEHHWTDRYLRIGDQDRARWIDKAWVGEYIDTLQWWEVARPDGVVAAWPA